MAHIHPVYDTDPHFSIAPESRDITYLSEEPLVIIQGDHNSERFTFEMPRYVDGHDMSLCNVVQVHYINISSDSNSKRSTGVYEIKDLQVHPEDENIIICSWLISQNATMLVGSLSFVLHFMCSEGAQINYSWGTSVYSSATISTGIGNEDLIVEQYVDVLQEWYMELLVAGTGGVNIVVDAQNKALESIETAKIEAIEKIQAVETIHEYEDEAIANITSVKDAAISDIEDFKSTALDNVNDSIDDCKASAISEINTVKEEALEEVSNTEKSTYATKEELKNYATNDSLQEYAKTEQLNNYATNDSLQEYAKTEQLGTQVTFTVEGTTLYINTI